MKRLLVSNYLLPISQEPIKEGAIVLDDDIIIDLGHYSSLRNDHPSLEVLDYSDHIILPGFVNCHTHLELSPLKGKIASPDSFADWIKQVIQLKGELTEELVIAEIEKSINELTSNGVVAIGDVSSDYLSYQILSKSKLIGRVYWEYIALKEEDIESRFERLSNSIEENQSINSEVEIGLSPHTPFTLCQKAFHKINQYGQTKQFHSTIHVGESKEEEQFFQEHQGDLYQFINGISPLQLDFKSTPLTYLYDNNLLQKDSMIIHLNILNDHDINILQEFNLSVVHCPLSHDFFDHPSFQLKKLLDHGITVALGSDSLASNTTLNFFEELRRMKTKYPFLSYEDIIKMATLSGAKGMKLPIGVGEIRKGAPYYLIAVPCKDKIVDPFEAVIYNTDSTERLTYKN